VTEQRYARLDAISWWDGAVVRQARAIVAGAGALGNEVVKNLVLLGWGTVVVIDHDHVEESNLTRSIFFGESDIGRSKADVLADNARRVNPDTRLISLTGDLRVALSAGLIHRADVVFGCLDNLAARVALSQLTQQADRVMIDGGLTTWEGSVQVFGPGADVCFACGLTQDDLRELTLLHSCLAYERRALAAGGAPTTPTTASVVGALMVQEAVKWLHRDRHALPVALGRELRVDLVNGRFWNHALTPNENCVLHREPGSLELGGPVSAHDSWRRVLEICRAAAGLPEGIIHLPMRVLLSWQCPACAASDDTPSAYAGDGPLSCGQCGQDGIPTFAAHVDGTEPWADRTPADMGLPPWSWLELRAAGQIRTFELAGAPASLDALQAATSGKA